MLVVTVDFLRDGLKNKYHKARKAASKLSSVKATRELLKQLDIAYGNELADLDMLDFLSTLSDDTLKTVLSELYKDLGDFSLVNTSGMKRRAIKTSKMIAKVEMLI